MNWLHPLGHFGIPAACDLRWKPDGQALALAGISGGLFVLASDLTRLSCLPESVRETRAFAWHPTENRLAASCVLGLDVDDELIVQTCIWDIETGDIQVVPDGEDVARPAWSPDEKLFAALDSRRIENREEPNRAPDGIHLARIEAGGGVRVWNGVDGRIVFQTSIPTGRMQAIAWHPNRAVLAGAASDGSITVWNTATRDMIAVGHSPDQGCR